MVFINTIKPGKKEDLANFPGGSSFVFVAFYLMISMAPIFLRCQYGTDRTQSHPRHCLYLASGNKVLKVLIKMVQRHAVLNLAELESDVFALLGLSGWFFTYFSSLLPR